MRQPNPDQRLLLFMADQSRDALLLIEAGADGGGPRVRFANRAAASLLGRGAGELGGSALADLAAGPAGPLLSQMIEALAGQPAGRLVLSSPELPLEATLERAPAERARPPCWLATLRPTAELCDAVGQGRAAEMLRQMGRMARIGAWELELPSRALRWTDQLFAIHDLPVGRTPSVEEALQFFPDDVRPWIAASFEDALEFGSPYDLTLPFVSATGQRKWVRAQCRVELHEGRPVRLRGTFQDITVYKEAEEALNAQSRALSMLSERERLAREIHDSLGQMLAYISMQAQLARDLVAQGRVTVGLSSLESVAQIAGEAQAEVRAFLRGTKAELGSRGFPTEDLVTAIRRLLDGLRESQPIQAELVAPAERKLGPFSPVVRLHLLRIVEEALVNVRRHAAARRVTVTIERDGDGLRVEVADDGRGFELAGVGDGQGYGLEAMRSRARDAGGRLQISSGPVGTRVVVWVPLAEGRASAA